MWVDFNLPQGKTSLSIGEPVQVSSRSFSPGQLTATDISDASLSEETFYIEVT
ncbi:MAG: hypothetical protein ACJA09_001117 [Alcanivorax sp.]